MSVRKQGDTAPPLVIDCFDGQGRRAPLDEATTLRLITTQRGTVKWQRDVTGDANGVVTVPLQAGDVAVPGTYFMKVFAEWADGTRQHYPPGDEYMTFTVTR